MRAKPPCAAWFRQAETEYDFIIEVTKAADLDESVKIIIFDINSPGGYAYRFDLTAQGIAGVTKSTESHIYDMAASTVSWIAIQKDKITTLSTASMVGSIRVTAEEFDDDDVLKKEGIIHRVYSSTEVPKKRLDIKTEKGLEFTEEITAIQN